MREVAFLFGLPIDTITYATNEQLNILPSLKCDPIQLYFTHLEYLLERNTGQNIVCAHCRNEIPEGSVAIEYDDNVFDSYQCLLTFNRDKGGSEDSNPSAIKKSTLKTILKL